MKGEAQGRLILHMSVSLDGFVAGRDGVIDWLASDDQHGATRHHANLEMIGQAGLIVLGRGAYEDMASSRTASTRSIGRTRVSTRRRSSRRSHTSRTRPGETSSCSAAGASVTA
jgi:dihydrofolate reductase